MKPLDEAMREAARALRDEYTGGCACDYPQCDCDYDCERDDRTVEVLRDPLLAALRALSDAGYVLVPREATKDMIAIGKIAAVTTHRVDQVYESMVAAAPKPTGQGGGG